jgi:surfactin synthase thioesterase subunit
LGALIAFELMHETLKKTGVLPQKFFALSRVAPDVKISAPSFDSMEDGEFLNWMQERYGGVPEAFFTDEEFREIFLPVLKADMEMYRSYTFPDHSPVTTPIYCYAGTDDRSMANREDLQKWSRHTTGTFELNVIPGGHFISQNASAQILKEIALISK